MLKRFIKLLLFSVLSINLYAQSGFSQEHLVSFSPQHLDEGVSPNTPIVIKYNLPIAAKLIHRATIEIKSRKKDRQRSERIKGILSIENDNTLVFTPSETLKNRVFDVRVKPARLVEFTQDKQKRARKVSPRMCKSFFGDSTKCDGHNYMTKIDTKGFKFTFTVDDTVTDEPKLTSLQLNKSDIELNETNTTQISVTANYDDNSNKDVTDKVQWVISDSSIISVTNNTITALKEGRTTLQAKFENQTSQEIQVAVLKVEEVEPQLLSLNLNKRSIQLNKLNTTQIVVTASYDDNSEVDITNQVNWIVDDNTIISVSNNAITALKEGTTTLQANFDNVSSQTIDVTVAKEQEVINGHVLPPEPDEELNNSTILGIDSNNNGVRDDVERFIYQTYTEQLEIGIFMQNASAYQKVIETPYTADATKDYIDSAYACSKYILKNNIMLYKKYEYQYIDEELEKIQFNTIERHIAYKRYNAQFNGQVLSVPEASKDKCEFDENGNLGGRL